MTPSLMLSIITSEEAKAQGLYNIASYMWPAEQMSMTEEIQRLKSLGKEVAVVEKKLNNGSVYRHLYTQPAGPKILGKHGEKYKTIPARKLIRVSKKTNA